MQEGWEMKGWLKTKLAKEPVENINYTMLMTGSSIKKPSQN